MNDIIPSQAVILAGGKSSRFEPFNSDSHKSNFKLMGKSIIKMTVQSLLESGVDKIIIVKSPNDTNIEESLADLKVSFVNQQKPLGMGNALLEVKDKLENRFLVVNPQQINCHDYFSEIKSNFEKKLINTDDALLFRKITDNPSKYGILKLDGNVVKNVVEKPSNLNGLDNQRIVGLYLLNNKFIKILEKTQNHEYQFETALNEFCQHNNLIALSSKIQDFSLKYAWDLFPIMDYLFKNYKDRPLIATDSYVHPTAILNGQVIIETGAQIHEYAILHGHCYIGKNSLVGSYCKIRKGTIMESNSQVQNNTEVKHSYLGKNSTLHSGFVGDSIIGQNCKIGAGFVTANRRLDRDKILPFIREEKVNSNLTFLGCIMGDNSKIGIHCGTNPGRIIKTGSKISPGTIL